MSYDLFVFAASSPDDLKGAWQAALAASGLIAEVDQAFNPAEQSGALAWKLQVARPDAFRHASLYPTHAVDAGFELTIRSADIDLADWKRSSPEIVSRVSEATYEFAFSNPLACSPADFRLQWFAAATLAQVTGGVLLDPQEERSFTGKEALAEAEFQANQYEEDRESDWPEFSKFEGW